MKKLNKRARALLNMVMGEILKEDDRCHMVLSKDLRNKHNHRVIPIHKYFDKNTRKADYGH